MLKLNPCAYLLQKHQTLSVTKFLIYQGNKKYLFLENNSGCVVASLNTFRRLRKLKCLRIGCAILEKQRLYRRKKLAFHYLSVKTFEGGPALRSCARLRSHFGLSLRQLLLTRRVRGGFLAFCQGIAGFFSKTL